MVEVPTRSDDVNMNLMNAETLTVDITSSGNATIWVQDRLDADLSSSGNVNYRGNPLVEATTSSSGRVMQISE